jgi:hypothetical protein
MDILKLSIKVNALKLENRNLKLNVSDLRKEVNILKEDNEAIKELLQRIVKAIGESNANAESTFRIVEHLYRNKTEE